DVRFGRALAMSELRSALEALQSEDLSPLPDAALEEDFEELQRAAEIIEVERLRRLAALDQRRPWLRDGCLSTTAWLAERFRMAHGAAAADVRMARALEAIPATREAASSGEISVSAVRVLVSAREADPDEFARSEPLLLDAAR